MNESLNRSFNRFIQRGWFNQERITTSSDTSRDFLWKYLAERNGQSNNILLLSRSCWCAQAGHQCLCVLSTWLVVCLVPCAPMSIVCPLPSCYLIIVSVAPAVSPSLPSFVSLYSLLVSAVLFWSVVFRVSMSCELNVWLCSSLLPACLFFPFGVVFVLLFNFVIKTLNSSAFESSTSSLVTERIRHDEDSAEGATGNHGSRA